MIQITRIDCDHTCMEESRQRAEAFRCKLKIDQEHDFSRMTYKIVKSKGTLTLNEVPVDRQVSYTLLRCHDRNTSVRIDEDLVIPQHAQVFLNEAQVQVTSQQGRRVFFRIITGNVEARGNLRVQFTALTPDEITTEFSAFWKPFWQRDRTSEQFQEETWQAFLNDPDLERLPAIPQITLDFLDSKRLMKIIRKIPSGKAAGPCGWTNDELKCLPKICVDDLSVIFQAVSQHGFGSKMMTAKTVLLSKIAVPTSMHHVRPVTILSSLYRLYSKVVFQVVAGIWKQYFPIQISGGLPGRGVKEIAYAQKRKIEVSLSHGLTCGGLTMDLIKAFNTFGRLPVGYIMVKLGIPQIIVDSWIRSLSLMLRYPTLDQHVGRAIPSTTGVPEGCSVSVLAMLATSCYFYHKLVTPKIQPFTYADNWSWLASEQRAHFVAFRQMQEAVSFLRLQLDSKKSWHWATTKIFRQACIDFHEQQSQFEAISVKTQTKDLGEMVHYDKSCTLGFIKEKMDEAKNRMKRIEWIPASLQRKAMLIQSSCWPLALYTADTTYIGQQHFVALRRGVLHALVGYWHTSSPFLACRSLSKHVTDPFLHVLCTCARTIRRFANLHREDALETIRCAVEYEGSRPYGPASTLKCYLQHVDWKLQLDGTIQGPENIRCNILSDSARQIVATFHRLWDLHLVQISDRKGIGSFYIDTQLGCRQFAKLTDEEQQLVKLNVVGGFQTEKRKAGWSDDTEGNCQFCGDADTRYHRLLECSHFQYIRDQNQEACRILEKEREEWVFLPLPRLHDETFLLQLFLDTVQEVTIPEPMKTNAKAMRFFTDGGASNPTVPHARIASWSVVEDISEGVSHQKQVAGFLNPYTPSFPLFQVSTLGHVKGQQTAARGELTAILVASKIAGKNPKAESVEFVTDAAYVCAVVGMICHRTFRSILHKLPNSDLILELASYWDTERFRIIKVKSHRKFDSAKDLEDLWRIAGNFCADQAASMVLKRTPEPMRKLSDAIANFQKAEADRLMLVFQYMAQFNKARAQAVIAEEKTRANHNRNLDQPKKPPDRIIGDFDNEAMGHDAFLIMRDFDPRNYIQLRTDDVADDTFHLCLQGANIGKALFLWARQLQWPPDYETSDKNDWGMSWLEIIFNFYIVTGYNLPIRTEGSGAKSVYISYQSPEALLLPKTKRAASLQILTFRNLLQNVQTIEKQLFFPQFKESKCKSLQRLGHPSPVAGVPRRPILPRQNETIVAVQQYVLALQKSAALHNPVYLKDTQPSLHFDHIQEETPQFRFNKYAQFMKKSRQKRQ